MNAVVQLNAERKLFLEDPLVKFSLVIELMIPISQGAVEIVFTQTPNNNIILHQSMYDIMLLHAQTFIFTQQRLGCS